MKIVLVKWQDATTFNQWAEATGVTESKLRVCYAAGFLVGKSKEQVTVALLTSEDTGSFSDWINIPAQSVLKITKLGGLNV